MAGHKENKDFVSAILNKYPLDGAIEWIKVNMCPEDIFDEGQLKSWAKDWAEDNNFIFKEEA